MPSTPVLPRTCPGDPNWPHGDRRRGPQRGTSPAMGLSQSGRRHPGNIWYVPAVPPARFPLSIGLGCQEGTLGPASQHEPAAEREARAAHGRCLLPLNSAFNIETENKAEERDSDPAHGHRGLRRYRVQVMPSGCFAVTRRSSSSIPEEARRAGRWALTTDSLLLPI